MKIKRKTWCKLNKSCLYLQSDKNKQMDKSENNPRNAGRKKLEGRKRELIMSDEELIYVKQTLKEIRANAKNQKHE